MLKICIYFRYAEQVPSFTFFINEDSFIFNVLTELIRALQAEKNTQVCKPHFTNLMAYYLMSLFQNLDRYSLAIQEILKLYGVSPDERSARNHIWKQFADTQQELMLPLLSSRYTVAQPTDSNFSSPIYGSANGTSFHSWVYK